MTQLAHSQNPLASRNMLYWFAAISAPFFLNDLANIFVTDFTTWILIDYFLVKGVSLALIVYLIRKQRLSLNTLGLQRPRLKQLLLWSVAITVIGIYAELALRKFLLPLIPYISFGQVPWDSSSPLATIDLYVGILLVAVSEEVIFRGLCFNILKARQMSTFSIFAISSILFGLIHWSIGPGMIVKTAIIGAIFMVGMWKIQNIWPLIVAHFMMDYLFFRGCSNIFHSPFRET